MNPVLLSGLMALYGLALFLRFFPLRRAGPNFGVDHWYWRYYVETLQKDKTFPPALPNYVLEIAQWYPPIFPLMIARFPSQLMERFSRWIAIGIDLARMTLMLGALRLAGVLDPWAYAATGLLYATTPILVSYSTQLNPRGLAALILDAMLMCFIHFPTPGAAWIVIVVLAALVPLTHKMTAQLMFFLFLCFAIITQRWEFLALIPASIGTAFVLSKGFYWKLLIAHWDAVAYWSKNWPLLGADPLRESPLYGRPGYEAPGRQFKPGGKNMAKRLLSIVLGNYAPTVVGAVVLMLWNQTVEPGTAFLRMWVASGFLFCVLTIGIPWLRGLGFGNLYLFNTVFPASVLIGCFVAQEPRVTLPVVAALLLLNLVLLRRSFRSLHEQKGLRLEQPIIDEIARYPAGSWLCFPMQLMEHVCYLAGKPVLWGGHGYGFQPLLSYTFPVIKTDFPTLMKRFGLRFMLVDDSYLPDVQRISVPQRVLFSSGGYHIIELRSDGS